MPFEQNITRTGDHLKEKSDGMDTSSSNNEEGRVNDFLQALAKGKGKAPALDEAHESRATSIEPGDEDFSPIPQQQSEGISSPSGQRSEMAPSPGPTTPDLVRGRFTRQLAFQQSEGRRLERTSRLTGTPSAPGNALSGVRSAFEPRNLREHLEEVSIPSNASSSNKESGPGESRQSAREAPSRPEGRPTSGVRGERTLVREEQPQEITGGSDQNRADWAQIMAHQSKANKAIYLHDIANYFANQCQNPEAKDDHKTRAQGALNIANHELKQVPNLLARIAARGESRQSAGEEAPLQEFVAPPPRREVSSSTGTPSASGEAQSGISSPLGRRMLQSMGRRQGYFPQTGRERSRGGSSTEQQQSSLERVRYTSKQANKIILSYTDRVESMPEEDVNRPNENTYRENIKLMQTFLEVHSSELINWRAPDAMRLRDRHIDRWNGKGEDGLNEQGRQEAKRLVADEIRIISKGKGKGKGIVKE
jgi:hypothetical protein